MDSVAAFSSEACGGNATSATPTQTDFSSDCIRAVTATLAVPVSADGKASPTNVERVRFSGVSQNAETTTYPAATEASVAFNFYAYSETISPEKSDV